MTFRIRPCEDVCLSKVGGMPAAKIRFDHLVKRFTGKLASTECRYGKRNSVGARGGGLDSFMLQWHRWAQAAGRGFPNYQFRFHSDFFGNRPFISKTIEQSTRSNLSHATQRLTNCRQTRSVVGRTGNIVEPD